MTVAIAIPVTTTPAASAVANGAAPANTSQSDGEGFAAALASFIGNGSSNTPQAHAAPHAPKSQQRNASAPVAQTDPNAIPVVPVVPSLIVTPAQQTQTQAAANQASAATQIIAQAAKGSALQVLQTATNAAGQTQATDAASTDQTATQASAQQPTATAGAFAALLAEGQQAKQPQAAQAPTHANAKIPAKPGAALKAAAPPADGTKPLDAAADRKPATNTGTAAVQHASANNANADAHLGSGKSDTAAQQVQGAAPSFTIALHTSSTDAPSAPAQPAPAPAAIPLDAVAVQMARKFESGESRFEIRLDPIELGKLDISMTVTEDGRVQAVLRAERPETLDMLQRDARLLENQLRQSGLNVDSGSLSFSLGGGNNQRSGFAGAMPNFNADLNLAAEPDTAPAVTSTLLSVRDGVDIKI